MSPWTNSTWLNIQWLLFQMMTLIFFALMAWAVYLGLLPKEVLLFYSAISCLTICVYGHDKSAAKKGRWRIPERTLHLLGLCGGWPGALLAQRMFHHKSRKSGFQTIFWLTLIINCAALGWFLGAFQN